MTLKPTLYLSGPISSDPRPIEEKRARFASNADTLRDMGYAVINPFDVPAACDEPDVCRFGTPEPGAQDNVHSWNCFLRADLAAMLLSCNGVATLDGWERSRGARLETDTARAVGMPIFPVENWLIGTCARCRQPWTTHHPEGARSGCDYAGPGTKAQCGDCYATLTWTGLDWEEPIRENVLPHMAKYCAQSKDSNPLHRPTTAGDLR
jgi:hypothetical protein